MYRFATSSRISLAVAWAWKRAPISRCWAAIGSKQASVSGVKNVHAGYLGGVRSEIGGPCTDGRAIVHEVK